MTVAKPTALHVFSTFAVGGPQVRFASVAEHLGDSWRHLVIAMDGNTACRNRLSSALDVSFPDVLHRKGATLANARAFRDFLLSQHPDVLVTSNWGSIEWAMANFFPVVRHIHIEDGFGPEERARQIPRRVWTRRLLLRRAEVVVPSLTLRAIAAGIWRVPHVRYLPNGIDLARFSPTPRPVASAPVIGTVAALRPEKNLSRLLRAFRLIAGEFPAQLVIVGDGPMRTELQAMAAEFGLADRVRFAGHSETAEEFYRGFDVFALSSDTEQMPLSVLEAMGSGLPVAGTDVGDVRAMLAAENANFVVPPDDAALADAMRRLLANPSRARAIGAANRAKAERDYDQEAMFTAYAALLAGEGPC
jgi:glycosyltransferase involved in cell wall biosynthesis